MDAVTVFCVALGIVFALILALLFNTGSSDDDDNPATSFIGFSMVGDSGSSGSDGGSCGCDGGGCGDGGGGGC